MYNSDIIALEGTTHARSQTMFTSLALLALTYAIKSAGN